MNLRNKQITLGELWDDPRARGVFRRRFPMIMKHPVRGAARTVTLEQLADFLTGWLPPPLIAEVLRELEKV